MKKLMLTMGILLALVGASQANAAEATKTLRAKCFFTEPFINVDLFSVTSESQDNSVLARFSGSIQGDATLASEVDLRKNGILTLTVKGESVGSKVIELNLGKKGSDGMSDEIMDVEATLKNADGSTIVIGGCNQIL